MKKIFLTALLCFVLVFITATAASASTDFELEPSEIESADAGQTITIDVSVNNITTTGGIESLDYIVTYSDTVTFSSATAKSLPDGWDLWTPVSDTSARTVKIAMVDDGSTANPAINDGDIVITLTFVVADDFDGGDSITVDFSRVGASAANTYQFVSGSATSVSYTKAVNKPEELTVTKLPAKTVYTAGQKFYSNGMTVSVTYTDGTIVAVTDYAVTAPDMNTVGTKDVLVTWGELTATFQITVNAPALSSITVTAPTKTSYYVGDTLNTTGMVVTANYANSTTADVTDDAVLSPTTFTATGTITVTVTYSTKSTTFTVTVTEKPATDDVASGTVNDISWAVTSDGTLTVSGTGAIPDYARTSGATAPWYDTRASITKIVVEDGITSIGSYAFYNLTKATSIEVAESVTTVGLQFIRGTGLTEISLPGVETVKANAFGRADNLTTIYFSESFDNALGDIFYSETVTVKAPASSYAEKYVGFYTTKFPNSDATVSFESDGTTASVPVLYFGLAGDTAFYSIYQKSSTNWSMVISGTGRMKNFPYVTEKNMGLGYTFAPTYYLNSGDEAKIMSMVVKEDVTTLGNFIFYRCTKANSLTLHDNITFVGRGAFYGCARLTTINIPESVTTIQRTAFNGCTRLTSVYIPEGVTTVEDQIFVKCNPENITVTTKSAAAIAVISAEYPEVTIVSE